MSARLEYEGRFLADIDDIGLFQSSQSQAIAIDIRFTTISYFQGEVETEFPGYQTRGRFFVIGKVGDVLQEQVAAMADATGWDGDLNVILQETWQPRSPVQIIVAKEKREKDRTYYNAIRILRADWQPARAGNVDAEDGRKLAARYTSALKSVVAKHRRQEAEQPIDSPPASAPTPPQSAPTPPASEPWTPEKVWEAFRAKGDGMSEDELEAVWNDALNRYASGKELSELTQEELGQMAGVDPKSWDWDIPF